MLRPPASGVPARRDERLVSQVDLPPTLLSLLGISSLHPMPGADLTVRDPNRAIMQYGDNYGYLKGDELLVLEPNKSPSQFAYDAGTESFAARAADPALAEEALAHALWASWAYLNQRYRVPDAQPAAPRA